MENNNRQGCRYRWFQTGFGLYIVVHEEGDTQTYIATADNAEKAHFIVTACNAYKEPESPIEPCATSSRIEELEKENARLKLLLEKEVKDYYAIVFPLSDKERRNNKWKQYQTENKL
jgi:hypothetical protein